MEMESAFAALLHTNYVPSGSEAETIRELLSGPLEARSRLDEKIARFRALIDTLRDEYNDLGAYIEDHLALTFGARRLPHNIIQEIFLHCLPTDRNAVMSVKEAPLLLGHICSGWRRIALSTPELWATLHVSVPNCQTVAHYSRWRQIVDAVKTWLNLSGQLPLSISVSSTLVAWQPDRDTSLIMIYLLNIFTQHSQRWERIDFTLPLPEIVATMSFLTEADVPLLKSVTIELAGIRPVNPCPPLNILNIPTLRNISMIHFQPTNFLQPLPWAQLTGLYLEVTSDGWTGFPTLNEIDALILLKQCAMLVTCKLLVESDPERPPPQQSIHKATLPFLRSLILIEGERPLGSEFIKCLDLPLLDRFGFRSYFTYAIGHTPFAFELFERQNKIEQLEIQVGGATSLEIWRRCLSYAKSVRRLVISAPDCMWGEPVHVLTDHFLFFLTPSSDVDLLCPLLEEITLEFCRKMSDKKILLFLQRRLNPSQMAGGTGVLKQATFTLNRDMVTDIMSDVQPLIAAGLKLNLKYLPSRSPILKKITETVEVPGGPNLQIDYLSPLRAQEFSPRQGLRTSRMMNQLD